MKQQIERQFQGALLSESVSFLIHLCKKQSMHDVHKACCYYSSRSCRVNPYRLTWPLSDIPTEIKILFLPTK